MYCYNCGEEIRDSAAFCEYCGAAQQPVNDPPSGQEYQRATEETRKKRRRPGLTITLIAIAAFLVLPWAFRQYQASQSLDLATSAASWKPPEPVESLPPITETTRQEAALSSAIAYLDFSDFSYLGLIDQLEYEGFSWEEALYGADNCGADWNEQALKSAEAYLSFSSFSYQGLIDQLLYEKFTEEQAIYGASNCSADWNEQAALSAADYLSISSFTRQELIEQLEYEGFTHEQAVYGASANGY